MPPVEWTERAEAEFLANVQFILQDSTIGALRLIEQVERAVASLAELPHRGRRLPELPEGSYREVIVRPYRLICRLDEERVLIVALRHGAQELTPPE